ncbi:hypothetical protein U1Q18_047761 [Sarracenia purpurea var. burkii]
MNNSSASTQDDSADSDTSWLALPEGWRNRHRPSITANDPSEATYANVIKMYTSVTSEKSSSVSVTPQKSKYPATSTPKSNSRIFTPTKNRSSNNSPKNIVGSSLMEEIAEMWEFQQVVMQVVVECTPASWGRRRVHREDEYKSAIDESQLYASVEEVDDKMAGEEELPEAIQGQNTSLPAENSTSVKNTNIVDVQFAENNQFTPSTSKASSSVETNENSSDVDDYVSVSMTKRKRGRPPEEKNDEPDSEPWPFHQIQMNITSILDT